MSVRKMNVFEIQISKKFESLEEAVKYQKRLKGYIEYTSKKNKWFCQAIIGVSEILGNSTYNIRYERTGRRGRPKIKREGRRLFDFEKKGKSGELGRIYTDIHLHVLIVSYPGESFAKEIQAYIKKRWNLEDKSVYVKKINIGMCEYIFNQCTIMAFSNCNYTELELLPEECSLRKLYDLFKNQSTLKKYDIEEYFVQVEEGLTDYEKLKNIYWRISHKYDTKISKEYMQSRIRYRKDLDTVI